MKAIVFKLLCLVTTVTLAAYVDKDTIAKERRTKFVDSFKDHPEELEHIREGMQTLQTQEKEEKQKSRTSPDVQQFSQDRQQLQQQLDQGSSSNLSPSIITNNEGLEEFLYQSDILLTPTQIDQMVNDGASRQKRQATSGIYRKWNKTNPVYYTFDPNFNAGYANAMRLSAAFWTENTCLNIVESASTPNIRVFHGSGCYSYVGYQGGIAQDLSLGQNCGWFGVATHELAHALGFWHEQSRHDRDSYITVDTANMDEFYLHNWRKESPATNENYGRPYDWGSGMHYGESAGKGTPIFAIAADKIYQSTMGSYTGPSFKDVYEMNLHYDCMCAAGAECQNGGFRHPRNCNTCICPSGFGGAVCNQLQASENGAANIGAVLAAQECLQTLTAKTGNPSTILERAQVVHWHITAPIGKQVEVTIESVAGQCNVGCPWGSLDIKVRNFDLVGSRFCCASDIAANPKLVSIENFAIVSLYSQAYEHSFTLKYRYIDPSLPNADLVTCSNFTITTTISSTSSTAAPSSTSVFSTLPSTTTSTVTPTPTNNGTCVDKFHDCQRYANAKRQYCDDETYAGQPWMLKNCAKFCSECGTITNPPCFDLSDNCHNYNLESCTDETYARQPWMQHNCKKYCGVCIDSTDIPSTTEPTQPACHSSTTTTPPICVDKFDDCQRYANAKRQYCDDETYAGQPWMLENCAKFCNECGAIANPPCFDFYDSCHNYANARDTYCFDETYAGQAWVHHNCRKFCGVCTDSTPTAAP